MENRSSDKQLRRESQEDVIYCSVLLFYSIYNTVYTRESLRHSLKYFRNLSSWRIVDELIDQPLTINLGEDAPLVVIPQGSTHRLVVHVWLVLVEAPQPGHRLAVHQLEDALLPVGPFNELGTTLFVLKVCTL